MESFQGRAPPTGWNDLPASLSPNLKFGGGSKKRINRNNLYQQYYNNNGLYSSYSSSSSSQEYINQPYNPNGPPPMMGQGVPPQPMMSQTGTMMGNPQQPPPPPPQMMGMQQQQQQQQTAQAPSVNYFNPASVNPTQSFNNQTYNNNTYQPNNFASQTATTPNFGSSNSISGSAVPQGSNISNDRKTYIMSIYNKHLDTYNASCSLFQRKIYEDARQRINTMYEELNNNLIDDQTFTMLEAIANALETKDINTASSNVTYLMRNSAEKKWILGVKELVDFICSN